MTLNRPALRYHGGKWRIAPWIISHFPPHRIYVEPFGGAASVLLRKRRAYLEVYNDLLFVVVNVFRVMKEPDLAADLERALKYTPYSREEFKLSYIPDMDPVEQARRTIVRAFMGFGTTGLSKGTTGFRARSCGEGSHPSSQWRTYSDAIPFFTARLQGVVVEDGYADKVINQHDGPDTLFYIDPPYVHSTRNKDGGGRYANEMSDKDHEDLAAQLHQVEGMVLISGYDSDLYNDLYCGWKKVTKKSYASSQQGQVERIECLWISPNCSRARLPLFQRIGKES